MTHRGTQPGVAAWSPAFPRETDIMSPAETHDAPEPKSGGTPPAPRQDPKAEPHPAIPEEDDPEIEKTEEQPS